MDKVSYSAEVHKKEKERMCNRKSRNLKKIFISMAYRPTDELRCMPDPFWW